VVGLGHRNYDLLLVRTNGRKLCTGA